MVVSSTASLIYSLAMAPYSFRGRPRHIKFHRYLLSWCLLPNIVNFNGRHLGFSTHHHDFIIVRLRGPGDCWAWIPLRSQLFCFKGNWGRRDFQTCQNSQFMPSTNRGQDHDEPDTWLWWRNFDIWCRHENETPSISLLLYFILFEILTVLLWSHRQNFFSHKANAICISFTLMSCKPSICMSIDLFRAQSYYFETLEYTVLAYAFL